MKKSLVLFSLLLTSCDCFQSVSGTVVDEQSGQPLAGVKVQNIASYDTDKLTDQNGYFEKSEIGPGFDCPELNLKFEKEGYISDTLNLGSGKDKVVKLRKK